jgi:hypothetical protein
MNQAASSPVWVVAKEPFRSRWVGWLKNAGLDGVAGWPGFLSARSEIGKAQDIRMMAIEASDLSGLRQLVLDVRVHFPTVALVGLGAQQDETLEGVIWGDANILEDDFLDAIQASVDWVESKWGSDPAEGLEETTPPSEIPALAHPVSSSPPVETLASADISQPTEAIPPVRSSPPSECQFSVEVGAKVGGYEVKRALGPTTWGDAWVAIQPGVNREVRLIVHRRGGPISEDVFVSYFKAAGRRRHPNLLTVYEVGTSPAGRFVVDELWTEPSLEQRIASGKTLDTRMVALLTDQVISALLDIGSAPVVPVEARHFLFNETGVLKVEHLEPSADGASLATEVQLARVAKQLLGMLRPEADGGAQQLAALLERLITGEPVADAVLRTSMARIVVDLAPEKEIELSEEQRAALEALRKAKVQQRRAIAGLIFAVVFLLGAAILTVVRSLARKSYTDFQTMRQIPLGEVKNVLGERSVAVPEFYMDEYEVTIYQYACFLRDLKRNGHLEQFEERIPTDWEKIKESVREGTPYQFGQVITLDSPIFNVDHFDASAYAKWSGKQLPTARQWVRAMRGDSLDKFPWGNDEDYMKWANTGLDYIPDDARQGGELDGFPAWNPVNATPGDVSRFQVKNLAGNVSEWLDDEGPTEMGESTKLVAGGNFILPPSSTGWFLEKSGHTVPPPLHPQARKLWLGFRCVADRPPVTADK